MCCRQVSFFPSSASEAKERYEKVVNKENRRSGTSLISDSRSTMSLCRHCIAVNVLTMHGDTQCSIVVCKSDDFIRFL